MTTKQKEIIATSVSLILLSALFIFAAIYFTKKAAESNHEQPTRPDYRIETTNGLEYPKY
jgi:hypothetical protein